MGDSLDPNDFLATALRRSSTALADDGFSARVAKQVRAIDRRRTLAKAVRMVCALGIVSLAILVLSVAAIHLQQVQPQLRQSLDLAVARGPELLSGLALPGIPQWALAIGAAALVITLAIRAADREGASLL